MIALTVLLVAQAAKPIADLPFKHEPGRIWLRGTLNGMPAKTILDSGAGGIIVAEAAASRVGGVKGAWFRVATLGGPSDAWAASNLTLGLEGAVLQTPATAIVSFARLATVAAPEVAVGFPLFGACGIQVDYVAGRVRIFAPETYVPGPGEVALPLKIVEHTPIVSIRLRLPGGKEWKADALIDTGSPVGIEVTRRLARRDGMDRRYADLPSADQPGGVGGATRAKVVTGVEGDLGGTPIRGNALVDLTDEGSAGRGSKYDVLLGDDLLRHFLLTFDYRRGTLWIRPNGK